MAVIDPEKRAFLPAILFDSFWPLDVEDDCDPVLVVVADYALVGVGRVGLDEAVGVLGVPAGLVVGHQSPRGLSDQPVAGLEPAFQQLAGLEGPAQVGVDLDLLAQELAAAAVLLPH